MITDEEYKKAKTIVSLYEKKPVLDFYRDELACAGTNMASDAYKRFIDFIFGDNELGIPLAAVLSIPIQLSFSQFCILIQLSKASGIKLLGVVLALENDNKYTKDKKILFLTLKNWITRRFVK